MSMGISFRVCVTTVLILVTRWHMYYKYVLLFFKRIALYLLNILGSTMQSYDGFHMHADPKVFNCGNTFAFASENLTNL
jgi:hypothetical protein